ncbi:hypothetical protein MHLP_01210 [Candidatus Mycoplasma haematolamae str. Purdue]|uniref:Uncharacterized protein n=1 Tax=Mycoplasma haematolamae (strain Purdue) TaxID=1212765 RepID=I7C5N4_MYCHA|nr:hypothetical protein [Candidatus Mycoplasma haematolamae]AFO51822.1 hypothetical protein MHLP_01210 [Candidatus Mycoplasma haematolamae str. Purdue]
MNGVQKIVGIVTGVLATSGIGGTVFYSHPTTKTVKQESKKPNVTKKVDQGIPEKTYTFKFGDKAVNLNCRNGYLPHEDAEFLSKGNMKISIVCRRENGSYRYDIGNLIDWDSLESLNRQGLKCQSANKGALNYQCTWSKGGQPQVKVYQAKNWPTDSYKREVILIN